MAEAEGVVPLAEVPATEKEPEKPLTDEPITEKQREKPLRDESITEKEPDPEASTEQVPKPPVDEKKIAQSVSFKEESNVVSELPEPQKKALDELKQLIQDALNKHEFSAPIPPPSAKEEEKKEEEEKRAPASEEPKAEEKVEEETPALASEEPKAEEKVEEEKPAPASEEPKAEEKVEEEKPAPASEEPKSEEKVEEEKPAPASGQPKAEEKVESEPSEGPAGVEEPPKMEAVTAEEKVAPAAEKAEVAEKASTVVVEVDGAKTVEAIEESIVSVSAAATEQTGEAAASAEVGDVAALPPPPPEEVEIWGIPLLVDERSDVILLKFLRARDLKMKDAFAMIKNTVRWRKEFGIDALLEEDLGNDWDKVVFTHGYDKEGHPVCYNVFGEFEDKELYSKTFSDEEKRHKFLRWRIQLLEKSVRKLDFSPIGISTIVQVNDLKNSPFLTKRELRQATNQALQLLQDNYPEFVAKQVFINVPWWYLAFSRMISAFLTQRTKSKFVFAGPSKSAETLFKYIAPEQVPVQYGGLSREGEQDFTTADSVTEVTIKSASKHAVEFPVSEASHLVWEVRVVGWDVSYEAEFVPSAEDGYTVIVHKSRKIAAADETVISNSYKAGEPGKVVLTIDNQTSKKKKLLYRSKTNPISE